MDGGSPRFNILQKISMSLMGVLVFITFIASNLHAVLWQKSEWLVSTVLPAVVVDLTNQERLDNKIQPLQRSAVLDAAAKLKADDMAKNQYFAHFSPTGVTPWHWFDKAGYVYAHAGENLAIHFTDSDEVVEAWMNSPTHRQNIVDNKYTEIGVATVKGKFEGYDTVYVVQLFGTPAVPPVAKTIASTPEVVKKAGEAEKELVTEQVIETESASSETVAPTTTPKVALAAKTKTEPNSIPAETEAQVTEESNTEVETELVTEANEAQINETPTTLEATEIMVSNDANDNVVLESSTIATSSGLAVANIVTTEVGQQESSMVAIATQPNHLLQIIYFALAAVVIILLSISIVIEARQLHFAQASYGAMLLFLMVGLWFFHSFLTKGAVIV